MQRAALRNARHGFDFILDAGQELADAADLAGHRHIDGDHRRAFGDAVAFENADAEFFDPQAAHGLVELFRPGHHVAQAAKIVGMRVFAIVAEEGRGAKEHRAIPVVDDFRDDPVMQRAGVKKDLATGNQRQQHATGQPEGVEQRQRHHEFIQRRKVGNGANLGDIGEQ